jgi:thiosulfate dehydrogenase
MGKFIFGVIIGLLLVPAGAYIYFRSGRAPVATSSAPLPFETFMAKTALHATLAREAPKTMSKKATDAELEDGVMVYKMHCAMCHGLPGKPESAVAKGMFPRPPQLLEPQEMVTDDPVGVTYWKAKNGIRLTGMPGFKGSLSDEDLYSVGLMLANADHLPADVTAKLAAPIGPPPAAPAPPAAPKDKPKK